MSEKPSEDFAYDAQNEKSSETHKPELPDHKPELSEEGGRRKSVALNIIQNPLKVKLRGYATYVVQ
jgi:hypothetical protein